MVHDKHGTFWKSVVILCPITAIMGLVSIFTVFFSLWDSYSLLSWTVWALSLTCPDTAVWWANMSDTSILPYCTALSVCYCTSYTKPDKKGTKRRDRFICSVMLNLSHFSSHRNNMLWPKNSSQTCRCSLVVHSILWLPFYFISL